MKSHPAVKKPKSAKAKRATTGTKIPKLAAKKKPALSASKKSKPRKLASKKSVTLSAVKKGSRLVPQFKNPEVTLRKNPAPPISEQEAHASSHMSKDNEPAAATTVRTKDREALHRDAPKSNHLIRNIQQP